MAEGQGPATPVGRDVIVGRVFAVRNGEPVADARIRLDPGSRFAVSDGNGRFAFPALPQGRYRMTVMSIRNGSVSDSVTLGFDGLRVVATLSTYRGDIVCTGPAPKPSNGR
jgi:Carboxypeptidase regulatory-like domain